MKTVVIGEPSGANREAIMAVYPRHRALVDKLIAQGVVLGIGPFMEGGNMAIFKTREAAETFSREDPFLLEGLVKKYTIKEWRDLLLPE
ncbi:MAG TPA: YciI family protein [Burkholderiales bacterium]|jgi:uncharacterized protein YciI|nr:YciI family protein [Burkholderiales bacterium]